MDVIFQVCSWQACDQNYEESEEENDYHDSFPDIKEKFLIKIFGCTEDGNTVALNIMNFTPHFYIKVEHKVDSRFSTRLQEHMIGQLPYFLKKSLIGVKLMKRKDFWGFTNFEKFNFARLTFNSYRGMMAAVRILSKEIKIHGVHNRPMTYKLYESNIEPMLRFMHIKQLLPSGWVKASRCKKNHDILPSTCDIDVYCDWKDVSPVESNNMAPFKIASFDIECTSSHGDFPTAIKTYKKVANQLLELLHNHKQNDEFKRLLQDELVAIFTPQGGKYLSRVYPKRHVNTEKITEVIERNLDDIFNILTGKVVYKSNTPKPSPQIPRDHVVKTLSQKLDNIFPELEGDSIIQIGTTVHKYGEKTCYHKSIVTLGSCDPIEGVEVYPCETEADLLLKWRDLINEINPDFMIGYNIFGFDMSYMNDRAKEVGLGYQFSIFGRIKDKLCPLEEKKLSSSALGDNIMYLYNIDGRVLIDIMKVVQRDHKLDSFKLDNVAHHFMGMNKNDVHPNDIFRLQKGTSADRRVIAEYCVMDCALCNNLMMKLEILANNIGMSNVCSVPLSYIFMRGQGIKIFSLVAKECKNEDFVIPTLKKYQEDAVEDGYEGAIVLEPKCGIYVDDPISVLDYASLYPSSMISENLSHDCLVLDSKYDNLPGVEYLDVAYDVYDATADKKVKVGERVCRYAQLPNNEKGVIPRILMNLLKQRKETRKKIEWKLVTCTNGESLKGLVNMKESEDTISVTDPLGQKHVIPQSDIIDIKDLYDDFQKAVLDGLQTAYKVTANSLYGQIGARTSQIYLKDIAACTTATGRKMIMLAKKYLEDHFMAEIVYGDSVTGDTPLLIKYPTGYVDIKTIDSITNDWIAYDHFKPWEHSDNKEQSFIDAEVWTNGKWSQINRVIRHSTNKTLYRVSTYQGCVDVTEDHSIMDINNNEIKPKDCKVGETMICHSFPTTFETSHEHDTNTPSNKIDKIESWVMGLFMRSGSCDHDQFKRITWSINSLNIKLLEKARQHLHLMVTKSSSMINDFKILDTLGVYQLVPIDSRESLVNKYREMFYDKDGYKKVPMVILNAPEDIRLSFMKGYLNHETEDEIIHDKWEFTCHGKIGAQGLYYLMKSLGWDETRVSIHDSKENTYWISNHQDSKHNKQNKNKVVNVVTIGENKERYVYDIETSSGVFQGGVGSIVCKNTDSIFAMFPNKDEHGNKLRGKDAIMTSIKTSLEASKEFRKILKAPHDLEYDKTFYPFILLSKKRYVANKYEYDDKKCKQASMGIVLKRRDNANIVKKVYGGIIDIILNNQDVRASIKFLDSSLKDLIHGKYPLEDLVISKSLRADYKDPEKIAHKVLADRMKERDPGNAPNTNDRIPYVYVQNDTKGKVLQGDRIETPDYIRQHNIKPDYEFYITNQIMNPVLQVYALAMNQIEGYKKNDAYWENTLTKLIKDREGDVKKANEKLQELKEQEVKTLLFDPILISLKNKRQGNREITEFFQMIPK